MAAVTASAPALAHHQWGTYRWATLGTGLQVKVNAALTASGGWGATVNGAVQAWNATGALTLNNPYTPSGASTKRCDPIAKEILVCNDAYGQRGWLGIASIWTDSRGHISKATTKLNDSYFTLPKYNTASWRMMVACQEIGHDFGLDHQDEAFDNYNLGTCMDYTNYPDGGIHGVVDYGPNNIGLNPHDNEELNIIYLTPVTSNDGYSSANSLSYPPSSSTTRGQPLQDFEAGSGDGPAEWGRPVRRDTKGRPDMFIHDFPDGRKVITHVFWALETTAAEVR
ncbi:MAG: hypothetical protein ABIT09_04705 [Croceibacterium sp.]